MDYSHELLALFNPAQYQQNASSDWPHANSVNSLITDLEGGENLLDSSFHYTSKSQASLPFSSENSANCLNQTRRPLSFNASYQNEMFSQSSNIPLGYSSHQSQFLFSVEDTCQATQPFELKNESLGNSLQSNYNESKALDLNSVPQRHLSFDVGQLRHSKHSRAASLQTTYSSSSTRRSSSLAEAPVTDHYPNYTTTSPSREWQGLQAPRKKPHSFPNLYLNSYDGPKYRSSNPKMYEVVRGVASGSVTRPPYLGQDSVYEFIPIELKIDGASIAEINQLPWSYDERQDGRRIVRIERRQSGHVVSASFSVVGSALRHPTPEKAPPNVSVVEVSCLSHLSAHEDNRDSKYSITSVEVVKIIEALIASTKMTPGLRRKEKGRIRSNLMPFWSKKPLSSKRKNEDDQFDSRTDFARRVMRYEVRKPRGFDKDVRILAWEKLDSALHRALQCYYAEVPKRDLVTGCER